MKLPAHVANRVWENSGWRPFRLTDSWESRPDDNGESHCWCCCGYLHEGDPCLVRYFEFTSVAFCMTCFRDNEAVMQVWMSPAG